MFKGKFITFEGGECTGKTTIINELAQVLEAKGYDVMITREPGGINIAEQIRDIILNPANTEMVPETEALLYAASRMQHLKQKVIPALKKGMIVLCDRYLDSSLVYQGYARGLGIPNVLRANHFALDYLPDITLFIDIDPKIALKRLENRLDKVDRLDAEGLSFHENVYHGYLEVAKMYPERIKSVNGNQSLEAVTNDCKNIVLNYLEK